MESSTRDYNERLQLENEAEKWFEDLTFEQRCLCMGKQMCQARHPNGLSMDEKIKLYKRRSIFEAELTHHAKVRQIIQSYLGKLPRDLGCHNFDDMASMFAKDLQSCEEYSIKHLREVVRTQSEKMRRMELSLTEFKKSLDSIREWRMPKTGIPSDPRLPFSDDNHLAYEVAYGSNGAREHIKQVAQDAVFMYGNWGQDEE
jgi:hypothetical protein